MRSVRSPMGARAGASGRTIPAAALTDAGWAVRRQDYGWACYSAASAVGMVVAFVLFGAAFSGQPRFHERGGLFQRISITTGFAWMSVLAIRAT